MCCIHLSSRNIQDVDWLNSGKKIEKERIERERKKGKEKRGWKKDRENENILRIEKVDKKKRWRERKTKERKKED